jgi:CheY-like chemotaxis protein
MNKTGTKRNCNETELEQAKRNFLNNMSHDLRTPLNAIIGYTTLAQTHLNQKELAWEYLNKISISSKLLLSQINDILEMSQMENGMIPLENASCNLQRLLEELQTVLSGQMQEKHQEFHMDLNISNADVICDQMRLNQILMNVLGNAVKYTPNEGTITLQLEQFQAKEEDQAGYRFIIRDNGPGMSEAYQEHIFEPFSREHNSTMSGVSGIGLGMSIVKNLVDLMEGRISVKSQLGEGCEVTIELVFAICEMQVDPLASEGHIIQPEWNCMRLLLVEDNPLNQEIAAEILSDYGFLIDVADNGKEALERLQKEDSDYYDAVLMDIQMPVMDGYEATKQIRKLEDEELAGIPIIAMTANAFEEDKQQALQSGMNDFLTKPIDVEQLLNALTAAIAI